MSRCARWCIGGFGVLLVALLAVGLPLANEHWPYRYRNVKPLLESVLASKLQIKKYHRTYFPRLGFVASGLTLTRTVAPNLPPVGTAKALIVQGSWADLLLLRNRVQLVDIVGLKVVVPPVGSVANKADFPAGSSADFAGPTTAVEKFHLRDAELDIQRVHGGVYAFPIHDLVIRNLEKGHEISYAVDMENAKPSGRILSKGKFGPLMPKNLGATALEGKFEFAPVDLSDVGNVAGTLSAKGKFSGTLDSVEARADVGVPDFAVGKGRATPLTAHVQGTVNGLNGNVVLHAVDMKLGESDVHAAGTIASATDEPKVTTLDVTVQRGRVQDMLQPFLHGKIPVVGVVALHGHVVVDGARGGEKFLRRLHVVGGFDVPQERLTDKATEQSLSGFSQRAQGVKQNDVDGDADVVSSLNGNVRMEDGVLTAQQLQFGVAGADAAMHGTFDFKNHQVDMVGKLRMDTDITHVTSGFKSFLLLPLVPFTKKKHAGAVIPIAVTGGPGHYKVGQDFLKDK
jgi:hypothetical protein